MQYQLGTNNLLKFTYQGSAGVDLVESWNINLFPTSFGANNPALRASRLCRAPKLSALHPVRRDQHMSNTGHSTYHSGTVQFQKRYSQGLVLNSFYTFSKAINDCDNDYECTIFRSAVWPSRSRIAI